MNFDKINNSNITFYEFSKNPENYFIQAFQPMGVFKELRNPVISFKKIYNKLCVGSGKNRFILCVWQINGARSAAKSRI